MLRSINSKFYAVVVTLLLSFCSGFVVIAYFLHQQSLSTEQFLNSIELQKDIATLNDSFHNARFWEKVIFYQPNPDAEKSFGSCLEQIRGILLGLESKDIDAELQESLKLVFANVDRYELLISDVLQRKTQARLLDTRLLSTFQSMTSMIMQDPESGLLQPLFGVTHFFIGYQNSRNIEQFRALEFVTRTLAKRIERETSEGKRLATYIYDFNKALEQSFDIENNVAATNEGLNKLSMELTVNIGKANSRIELLRQKVIHVTGENRTNLGHIFLGSTLIGTLSLLLILRLLNRKIIEPVGAIARVMSRVQNGDMTARFHHEMKDNDEILEMGLACNKMLESIELRDNALKQYQIDLEEKLAELSRQRTEQERLTKRLQRVEKMEVVGTLAGGVAHDLNNILSGVVSYPELLLLDMPEDNPYRKPLVAIRESGQRAVMIVQDLLTLARRGAAVLETTNLNALIKSFVSSPEFEKLVADHPGVAVITELRNDLFNIQGSKTHLQKTIMNLVVNAIESLDDHGTVTVSTENRYISEPIPGYDEVVEGDYAVIIICDSGSGIDSSDLEHIFEPFFTRKAMGRSGSGLGLAVVWGVVKDLNGYIDVQSTAGKGTTFALYFPISREAVDDEACVKPIELYKGNGEKILIVDDVEQQRDIASKMLGKLGYQVFTSASGEEAIEYLKQHRVDLLVLDMLMPPGIDGLETYKQVVALYPGQKAIIASGYSETQRVIEAQRLGVADYIRKPYSIETIGLAIQAELRRDAGLST